MKTQMTPYSRPLLTLAFALFIAIWVIVFAVHWKHTQDQARDMNIVSTARHEAIFVMPPYKDRFHREYFDLLTSATDYRLEKKGTHEAIVWLTDGGISYLRVSMRQMGDGTWSVRNTQMFIDPNVIAQNQKDRQPSEPQLPVAQ